MTALSRREQGVTKGVDRSQGRATMADVAQRAGVALKTVSRVVNGESRVSASTAEAVRRAIQELGYVPNASAQSLARGSSHTIGLIVEDIAEPIQALMSRAIEETVSAQGRLLFTASSLLSPEREEALVSDLAARQVEGLIVIATGEEHRHLEDWHRSGLPIVFVDRPPRGFQADAVTADNYGGAYLGVEHLLNNRHRRIAFVTGRRDTWTGAERLRAYRECLQHNGIDPDDSLELLGVPRTPDWLERFEQLFAIADPPTAVFSASSTASAALLRALGDGASRFAMVGFDDLPFGDLLRRPLTVVAQDPLAIGRTAAQLLLERLSGESGAIQRIQIGCRLIIRETEAPRLPAALV